MGLFPEIPIIPAFPEILIIPACPEIPENSPKKAKPFNNINLPKPHYRISCEKRSLLFSFQFISCQKGSDLFYRKRRSPRDSTLKYSPWGLTFGMGQRCAPYHKKFTRNCLQKPPLKPQYYLVGSGRNQTLSKPRFGLQILSS